MPAHTVSVEACDVVLEREVWPGTTLRARCMGHVPGREGPHQYRLADAVLVVAREDAVGVAEEEQAGEPGAAVAAAGGGGAGA